MQGRTSAGAEYQCDSACRLGDVRTFVTGGASLSASLHVVYGVADSCVMRMSVPVIFSVATR